MLADTTTSRNYLRCFKFVFLDDYLIVQTKLSKALY